MSEDFVLPWSMKTTGATRILGLIIFLFIVSLFGFVWLHGITAQRNLVYLLGLMSIPVGYAFVLMPIYFEKITCSESGVERKRLFHSPLLFDWKKLGKMETYISIRERGIRFVLEEKLYLVPYFVICVKGPSCYEKKDVKTFISIVKQKSFWVESEVREEDLSEILK
jgi:hypothetical protein